MIPVTATDSGLDEVSRRVERTLRMMHEWGYSPTLEALASNLLGGQVAAEDILAILSDTPGIVTEDGFVYLAGYEDLFVKSKRKVASHRVLNGEALEIAESFTRDLVKVCPFLTCIALSGSAASGGYGPEDDVDFDLFVRPGTKYLCYLIATLVGLKYAWRYRHREVDPFHRALFLPKVTCINVVWTDDQTRPFVRQDAHMAFELLRCRPLYGTQRFGEVLDSNPWIREFFPQRYDVPSSTEVSSESGSARRILETALQRPLLVRLVEAASRGIVWVLYSLVQWTRRGNPDAVARTEFLRRVKAPYEVFQD